MGQKNSNHTDVAEEYAILQSVADVEVGPKPIALDMHGFQSPILFEEFITGTPYAEITSLAQVHFDALIALLNRTSQISVPIEGLIFTNSYTSYKKNFDAWDMRIREMAEHVGDTHDTVLAFRSVAEQAKIALHCHEDALSQSVNTFIYNDIHGDNVLYLSDGQAKFVDWQKVSLGDPAFMAAVCAHRMGKLWGMSDADFSKKVLHACTGKLEIPDFEELFRARILERTVSDMTWSVWDPIVSGAHFGDSLQLESNKYYNKALKLLSGI